MEAITFWLKRNSRWRSVLHTIRWNGRAEIARDRAAPLTVRFRLRCATLFAFELR